MSPAVRTFTNHRSVLGLTLIELLASLVTLGGFVAGAGAWLSTSARAGATLGEQVRRDSAMHRTLETLRTDLDACDPASIAIQRDGIAMRTASVLPGEPVGWARVRWRFDVPTGELRREAQTSGRRTGAAERMVLAGVVRCDIEGVDKPGAADRGDARETTDDARVIEVRLATRESGASPIVFVWSTRP